MKTYVKQIIVSVIVSTVIVCLGYGVNKYVSSEPEGASTVVGADGSTYLAVYDEQSNTYVAVTDADGRVVVAATDANGNVASTLVGEDGKPYYVDNVNASDLPTNTTQPQVSIDVTNDPSGFNGTVETSESTAPTSTSPTESTATTTSPSTKPSASASQPATSTSTTQSTSQAGNDSGKAHLADKYRQLFEGGTYLMEFTTNDSELSETPVTAAFKNGNILMSTTLSGMDCTMLYIAGKQTGYLVLNNYKKYCKLPDELLGTMSSTSGTISDGEFSTVGVSNVTINGEQLLCEEYKNTAGATIKYYFNGETLVRRDRIDADGTETNMYFTKITSDVPDSTFEIPDNYGYVNLSWAGFLFD